MPEKIKVLAVDDEKFNLILLRGCLKSDMYDITGCTNAVDALQEFKKQYFDVLLLDVLMPGIDGFELRKLIREIDAERPIIFLTALVDDINTTMLNQISWDPYTYYLNKSFSKKLLSSKIEQAVGVHRSRKTADAYSRKLEDEMALAGDIQKILLPAWCVVDSKTMMGAYYAPSGKVSGDLYEFLHISGGKYLLFIGDIAGHGMQAALYMAAMQSVLKVIIARGNVTPHELLNHLNEFFCSELCANTYMTCLAAIIDFDANKISVQSAGHPGLIGCSRLKENTWRIGDDSRGGPPVGWFESTKYSPEDTTEATFPDDTLIVGYTDGLIDACTRDNQTMNESELFELIGVLSLSSDAATFPYRLGVSLGQLGYDQSPDDVCVVAVQKNTADGATFHNKVILPKLSMVSSTAIEFAGIIQNTRNDMELATKIEILLYEYLNNVIIHGSEGTRGPREPIYVSMTVNEKEISVRGLDRGKVWDMAGSYQPAQQPLNEPTFGRGIQIIREITDHVTHGCYNGLNETVFSIKLG